MNTAPNIFVLTEPLFYVEKTRTQGCTDKEFVNHIEPQRLSNGWDQLMTATKAHGIMRDAAHMVQAWPSLRYTSGSQSA
jgi:hypothetical protein